MLAPAQLQLEALNMDPAFLNRNVNEGFSGALIHLPTSLRACP